MDVTVAVDCMGGDHGPHVTVPAALAGIAARSDLDLILVGLRDAIEAELRARGAEPGPRLRIHHASEIVGMDEPVATALRSKRDSSMRVALNLVKSGEAQACVSAGIVQVLACPPAGASATATAKRTARRARRDIQGIIEMIVARPLHPSNFRHSRLPSPKRSRFGFAQAGESGRPVS